MNILTCAPNDCAFNKEECCVCGKEVHIGRAIEYVITKSGLFVCRECLDRLARENKRKMERDSILSERLRQAQESNIEFGIKDNESIHAIMDLLVIEELESLGYKESAKIFRDQEKYYG